MKRIICLILVLQIVFAVGCRDGDNNPQRTHTYSVTNELKSKDVKAELIKVNKYFQQNLSAANNGWDDAVYHSGNIRAYMITGIKEFYDYSLNYAINNNFFVNNGANTTNGDFYCISQVYLDLYKLTNKEYMLTDVLRNANFNANKKTSFDWVDLLYMSLPVLLILHRLQTIINMLMMLTELILRHRK